MIPNFHGREVESQGVTETAVFGISVKDTAHIMSILRDTLYSDKILAVLREYAANAWDAHKEVGKGDEPIKITLPTAMDPTLVIQDFGPGLSHQDVFEVYTQYGASTKRSSDTAVGMLGIGSKSGFAYSDSFQIISCHGGKRRIYVAVLDETEKGTINLLSEEELESAETGVSIVIPVRQEDIWEFHTKAQKLFQYFRPLPIINTTMPTPPSAETILVNGILSDNNDEDWVAVMGCIPYRINLDQLKGPNAKDGGIGDHVDRLSGALFFNIGDLSISASREELKYTKQTKDALVAKINDLIEEYVLHTMKVINTSTLTPWEKRIRAQVLLRFGLPIPKECKAFVKDHVEIKKEPVSFTINKTTGNGFKSINVSDKTRLIIKNDDRAIIGYNFHGVTDHIIAPRPDAKIDDVRKELNKLIADNEMTGVTVVDSSTLAWFKPVKVNSRGYAYNKKHFVKLFILKKDTYYSSPWSKNWDIAEREPKDNDVFVIIRNFRGYDKHRDIFSAYKLDARMAEAFGATMPEIYGYKSTSKKPVDIKDCKGVEYFTWRKTFAKSLLTPSVKKKILKWQWANAPTNDYVTKGSLKKIYAKVRKFLGDEHPIVELIENSSDAMDAVSKFKPGIKDSIEHLIDLAYGEVEKTEADLAIANILARYPLLSLPEISMRAVWGDKAKYWTDYVLTVDKVLGDL